MQHTQPSFEDLLEALYASVLAPARFDEFAARLRLALDSHIVAIQADDGSHTHDVRQHYVAAGTGPPVADINDDARINQFFLRGSHLICQGVVNGDHLFEAGELEHTAFYQEILAPMDVRHSIGSMVSIDSAGMVTAMSVSRDRHREPFGEDESKLLRRLLPHVRNVHAIWQRIANLEQIGAGFEHLGTAACLLDANGNIVRTNAAADSILDGRDSGILRRAARLSATWRPDRPAVDKAISDALKPHEKQRSEIVLHGRNGQPWGICRFHPLHTATGNDWMLPATMGAMAFISPFAQQEPPGQELFRQAFGLTPAEAQLAQALLRHGSLAACRDALRKSRETLRTQLKSLFAKTGTRRQSELLLKLQELAS